MSTSLDSNLIVERSSIQGRGVFAGKNFAKGEKICVLRGKDIKPSSYERMFFSGNKRVSCDPLQVGCNRYITLEDPYNLINHSCNPNAAIKGSLTLVAMKKIEKGEEIAYDYSAVEWTPQSYPPYYANDWPMSCTCGSRKCRKTITCFPYLPAYVKRKYLKSGAVPRHIFEKRRLPLSQKRCFVCEWKLAHLACLGKQKPR